MKQKFILLKEIVPQKEKLYTHSYCWLETELKDFEKKYQVKLPEGYRKFLLEIGDGGAGFAYYGISSLREKKKNKDFF